MNSNSDILTSQESDLEEKFKTIKIDDTFSFELKYKGVHYRLADYWTQILNYKIIQSIPIKYCEVGVFYGVNFITFEKIFGQHKDTEMVAIDPWIHYDDYPEYKDKNMQSIYNTAIENMKMNDLDMNKVKIIRDFSHNAVKLLKDEYFDIIYIDGNHESYSVIEDAVLYFRKLKVGGIMIFDDIHDDTISNVCVNFTKYYESKLKIIHVYTGQLFLEKIKS